MHLRWRLSGNTCQRIIIRSAARLIIQAHGLKLYTHLSTAHAAIRLNSIYYSKSSLLYFLTPQDSVGEVLVRASIAYAMKNKVRSGANICTTIEYAAVRHRTIMIMYQAIQFLLHVGQS